MPSTTSTRKRKGAGNIQKKANGSYLGRIRITGYDTYYYTGTSEKDVQKNLNEFYEKTQRHEIIARKETVNTYIERWLEIYFVNSFATSFLFFSMPISVTLHQTILRMF